MIRNVLVGAAIALGFVCLSGSASQARAEVVTYDLTNFNQSSTIANYAALVITSNTSGAGTAQFDIRTNFAGSVDTGALMDAFGFSLSIPVNPPTAGGIDSSDFAVTVPSDYVVSGPGSNPMDGFGKFQWSVQAPTNSSSERVQEIEFTITGITTALGSSNWNVDDPTTTANSIFALSTGGNGNHLFAAEYFPSAGATGFIDGAVEQSPGPPPFVTPEPSSSLLFGVGFSAIGLCLGIRRKLAPLTA